jgi:hypothetical protein
MSDLLGNMPFYSRDHRNRIKNGTIAKKGKLQSWE